MNISRLFKKIFSNKVSKISQPSFDEELILHPYKAILFAPKMAERGPTDGTEGQFDKITKK